MKYFFSLYHCCLTLCVWIYISLDVHLLGPQWFLMSILLTTALGLDSLLCYYCPLQRRDKSCPNITSECLPNQRCSSSRGHYGSLHILSAQGCVDTELCGSHETISYRGVKYTVSHTCCCKDKCNSPPKSNTNLKMLLGMTKGKKDNPIITNVLMEEPLDSCANYTSSRSSTLSVTAS